MSIFDYLGRPDRLPFAGNTAAWPAPAEPSPVAELGEPAVYRIPFPPPSGRRVRDRMGTVWIIDPTGDAAREDDLSHVESWGMLLAVAGPLALLPLTPEETASEALYGPVGARWGTPGTPCAFDGCALDVGHTGPHRDDAGQPLHTTARATSVEPGAGAVTRDRLRQVCTCGVARHLVEQHEPHCARYVTPPDGTLLDDGDQGVTIERLSETDPWNPNQIVVRSDPPADLDDDPRLWTGESMQHDGLEPTGWETIRKFPEEFAAASEQVNASEPDENPATPRKTARKAAPRKASTPPPARKRAPRKGTTR